VCDVLLHNSSTNIERIIQVLKVCGLLSTVKFQSARANLAFNGKLGLTCKAISTIDRYMYKLFENPT